MSTNVWWLSLASLGEAWHHNHHAFPRSADPRPAPLGARPERRAIIGGMQKLGLAWNVVRITPERQAQKLADASPGAAGALQAGYGTRPRHRIGAWPPGSSPAPSRTSGSTSSGGSTWSGSRSGGAIRRSSSSPATRSSSTSPACRRSAGSRACARRCSRTATPIWPQGKKKHPEDYPWRVEAEPVAGPRGGGVRPRRVAARRARAPAQVAGRALAPRLPGPAAHGLRRGRGAAGRADRRGRAGASSRTGDPRAPLHRRGGERACCRRLERLLRRLREARDRLTDAEAHELLADRRAGQRRRRSPAARSARRSSRSARLLGEIQDRGIVVRDIDRGLIDFPAILDGREVYLCWELDEDGIGFWHDLESGFGGRQPLD